ncbi:MAG: hypothetical protein P8O83_04050 [Flavobacteriaceae bacterium]|nr:hypothetical protein [Flavobacteriaceae bacterium]
MQNRILIYIAIILLGFFMASCGISRTFQMDNSKHPLYYHDAYWVAKIKPEGAPAKITVINDMHIDTSTNRVTVYAQSRILGKIVSPPQVGSEECIETKKDTLCFHPNAVYLNGSGAELDSSDGSGAWWVKHSWVLGGEGYQNWEMKPKKNYGDGNYVEGIILEDRLTMKIGIRKDSMFTDYNLRMPIIDTNTRQVYYQVVRYEFSHKNESMPEEKFKLVWKCKKRKSPFNNDIRTCPKLIWQ